MDLNLKNTDFRPDGIFGILTDTDGGFVAEILQHAYQQADGSWAPKVPPGTYTCVRGMHLLEGMTAPFATFEVTNVPNHSGILFHIGNYNRDSDGCLLIGEMLSKNDSFWMILDSRVAFTAFMNMQANVDEFILTVN